MSKKAVLRKSFIGKELNIERKITVELGFLNYLKVLRILSKIEIIPCSGLIRISRNKR